jgi:hypothetical protein
VTWPAITPVHHCTPHAQRRSTDVNDLTFGCGGHHPLAEQGWTTAKTTTATPNGSHPHTSTTVAPAPRRSTNPEKLLREDDEDVP